MSKLTKAFSVLAGALLAVASASGTASAAPYDRGTFDEIETSLVDCGNMQLNLTVEDVGRFVDVEHGPGGPVYDTTLATRTETAVNVANGKTMIVLIKGLLSKDLHIVDNGDGTQTITLISPSRLVAYAPDGSPAYVADGLETVTFTVDANGEFLELVSVDFAGYLTWPGLCDAAAVLLS
jgi:hypothetical protein